MSQYFPPDMGGGATRAYNVAEGLVRAGCDVTVVSAFPHYPTGIIPPEYKGKTFVIEKKRNIRLIRTYIPPLESKGYFRRFILFFSFLISSLLALPYVDDTDVIWVANPNIIGTFAGSIYGFFKKCPLVQNVDDLWPEALFDFGVDEKSYFGRLSTILASIAYHLSSAITPISPAYVSIIEKKYRVQSSRIETIKAGVDVSKFATLKEVETEPPLRVLYIGAFSPAYDFDQIFEAAKLLSDTPGIEIQIRGGGELRNHLKKTEAKYNLDNIEVIDKIVNREEVRNILQRSDILMLPLKGVGAIELGISSKLYEYQASGKPIICCSTGQPGRYVSATNSGIVVKPGNYHALAESILRLRNNVELRQELGNNGRAYVERHLTLERIGEKFKNLFSRLLTSL